MSRKVSFQARTDGPIVLMCATIWFVTCEANDHDDGDATADDQGFVLVS